MALLDFLKKPKKEIKKKEDNKKTPEKKAEVLKQAKKPVSVKKGKKPRAATEMKEEKTAKIKKKTAGFVPGVLFSPHVTEKATILSENNKYIFKIQQKANKIEIRKAIEGFYGVDVEGVKIINIHPKKRKVGRHSGWTKGYKKAIVKVKEGQKIEILPR